MLKKINRITKKNDFNKIFTKGKASFGRVVGIKTIDNGLPYSRFGIIVSTKVSKKAVARNKIKRRIREIIRKNLNYIGPGHDYIIITLPPILEKDFQETEHAIINNLSKLHARRRSIK